MHRLRKKNPPFGTAGAPIWEYAYSEQVKVVDGFCEVQKMATRDYLLKIGYEEVMEEELETVGINTNGVNTNGHEDVRPQPPLDSRLPSNRKKKRGR